MISGDLKTMFENIAVMSSQDDEKKGEIFDKVVKFEIKNNDISQHLILEVSKCMKVKISISKFLFNLGYIKAIYDLNKKYIK